MSTPNHETGVLEDSKQDAAGHVNSAHCDAHGNWIHDPINNKLAEDQASGKCGPQPSGPYTHPFPSAHLNGK